MAFSVFVDGRDKYLITCVVAWLLPVTIGLKSKLMYRRQTDSTYSAVERYDSHVRVRERRE